MTKSASGQPTGHTPTAVIGRLKDAWAKHDIQALTELFGDSFTYQVNGKSAFSDKAGLRNYWCKNRLRQRDLEITFYDGNSRGSKSATHFTAYFFHPLRMMITVISGKIEIEIDKESGTIKNLTEHYQKIERHNALYTISYLKRAILDPIKSLAYRTVSPIWRACKSATQFSLVFVMWAGVASVVYVNFGHDVYPILSEKLSSDLAIYTPIWFAIAYIVQQSLPFLKKKIEPDLSVKAVSGEGDLKEMKKQIEGADHVQIVSGDFSFIDTDPELEDCLRRLAFAGKLRLISYKSKESVTKELNTKSSGREIMLKLMDDDAFAFEFPVHAKVTIVNHGGSRRMLFRFGKDVDGKQQRFMGFVRDTPNTPALLDVVTNLMDATRKASK